MSQIKYVLLIFTNQEHERLKEYANQRGRKLRPALMELIKKEVGIKDEETNNDLS